MVPVWRANNYTIVNGTLVTKDGLVNKDLVIENGKIRFKCNYCNDDYREYIKIDADNCFILPGGIDPHVHLNFNFKNRTTKLDAELGGETALLNGITTVYDFIVDRDGSISPKEAIKKRREELKGIPVNLKFHYCFDREHDRVAEFIEDLYDTDISVIIFGFYKVWNEEDLRKYLPLLQNRFWLGCHALAIDDHDIKISKFNSDCIGMRKEIDKIEKEIFMMHKKLAEEYNLPLYMFHMSNPELMDIDIETDIIREVTHQHLFHSIQDALETKYGKYMVSGPWLQTADKRRSILKKIDKISCIASDDASFDINDKIETGNQGNMIKGIPSLGYKLPMMYTFGLKENYLDWESMVGLWSYNIAHKLCSQDNIGVIEEGADADIVIIEPGRIIRSKLPLETNLNWYPFEYDLDGWARDVFISGKHIVKNGHFNNRDVVGEEDE